MICIQTIADIYGQNYALGLYCLTCDRWGEADLEQLLRCGRGKSLLSRMRFRCRECGEIVDKQLRPPVPSLGGAVAYIQAQQTD